MEKQRLAVVNGWLICEVVSFKKEITSLIDELNAKIIIPSLEEEIENCNDDELGTLNFESKWQQYIDNDNKISDIIDSVHDYHTITTRVSNILHVEEHVDKKGFCKIHVQNVKGVGFYIVKRDINEILNLLL